MTAGVASDLLTRIESFLKPLYQDLDGGSRLEEALRIGEIAATLYHPQTETERRHFDVLILFQRLGKWLDKPRNFSRAVLVLEPTITTMELRRAARVLSSLENPTEAAAIALAAAAIIDAAGLRGLAEDFASARREGTTALEIAAGSLAHDEPLPEWFPEQGHTLIDQRRQRRREVCRMLLDEEKGVL